MLGIEPLETMVADAERFPEGDPVIASGNGIYVLRPRTEPFEDSEHPLVVMEYSRLKELLDEVSDVRRVSGRADTPASGGRR